jgi:N-acetylglucosaminyl-diphospho-decaprenol L-rhamnosyltransferase
VDLDVVIVNFNAGDHLGRCLRALGNADRSSFTLASITVVDNGSEDESLRAVAADADAESVDSVVNVLSNRANRGFAAACNQGARAGAAELLVFVNPDAEVFPETLAATVGLMADPARAEVGICGGQMVSAQGESLLSCSRFPSFAMYTTKMLGLAHLLPRWVPRQRMTAEETAESGPVDQVIGAFFMIRRSLFESLGGFDERFFVYMEEVDLALRAAQLGYRSYFLKTATVYHREGISSEQIGGRKLFYLLRSQTEFARKHFPAWQAVALVWLFAWVEIPVRLLRALAHRRRSEVSELRETAKLYRAYARNLGPSRPERR